MKRAALIGLLALGACVGGNYPPWPPCGGSGSCAVEHVRPSGEVVPITVRWGTIPGLGRICGKAYWRGEPPVGPATIYLDPASGPGTWRHELLHAEQGHWHSSRYRSHGAC